MSARCRSGCSRRLCMLSATVALLPNSRSRYTLSTTAPSQLGQRTSMVGCASEISLGTVAHPANSHDGQRGCAVLHVQDASLRASVHDAPSLVHRVIDGGCDCGNVCVSFTDNEHVIYLQVLTVCERIATPTGT